MKWRKVVSVKDNTVLQRVVKLPLICDVPFVHLTIMMKPYFDKKIPQDKKFEPVSLGPD